MFSARAFAEADKPNIEPLAAMGTRFSNFYSHNVCSPTRISIMNGQNAARHRNTDWINPYRNNRDMDNVITQSAGIAGSNDSGTQYSIDFLAAGAVYELAGQVNNFRRKPK